MTWSRRKLLTSVGSASLLGVAGCSDGVQYSAGGSPTETPTSTPTETTAQPTEVTESQGPERTPNESSALVEDTARVFDEVEWFATQYRVVIGQALGKAGRVHDELVKLRRSPSLSENDLERVERSTREYYDFLTAQLEPHFPATLVDEIVQRSRTYVSTLKRFSERGDLDRAEQELSRLIAFYELLQRRGNFTERFDDFPVHGPLTEYLTSDSYASTTPLAFVVSVPGERYTTLVRADETWDVRSVSASNIGDQTQQRFFEQAAALFGGVSVETGRTGQVFLNAHLNAPTIRHTPIYLQRFRDQQRAADAYGSLLEGSVFVEESVDIGRTTWEHAYYYQEIGVDYPRDGYVVYDEDGHVIYDEDGHIQKDTEQETVYNIDGARKPDEDGDIVYIYFTRIGRYLVAASPSMTAWEERDENANTPLKQTWLFE